MLGSIPRVWDEGIILRCERVRFPAAPRCFPNPQNAWQAPLSSRDPALWLVPGAKNRSDPLRELSHVPNIKIRLKMEA